MTEPLTLERLNALIKEVFKPREPEKERWPKQFSDMEKLREIGFKAGWDEYAGMYLTSGEEMRRAREAGAIWWEDENGNRVLACTG